MDTEEKLDLSLDQLVAQKGGDRGTKRMYDDADAKQPMDGAKNIAVAKRIYVGNMSWRTSWQGLKVGCDGFHCLRMVPVVPQSLLPSNTIRDED